MPSYPVVDFEISAGLYTKSRQEEVSALLQAQNVDFYDVAGGVGKVPGTQRRSDTFTPAASWKSLHFHDGYLSGTLTRIAVGCVGTTLQKINADQTLLALKTGLTSEPLFGVSSQDRLHLASANNTPIKVALDGTVSNWGITPPSSAPTATKGVGGNVDAGKHRYVVTFVSTYGKESNRSDPSDTVISTGSTINLASIPVSSEAQVVSRKIYRDDQEDALYRFVATISDNTTTTYSDNASTADLSTATAPEDGGALDNAAPENMSFVATYESYIFGALASDPNTIIWSETNEPEYFPSRNARTFNTRVTALTPILGGLIICGSDWMVAVTGGEGGSRTLQFNEVNPELGCVGPRAITRAKQAILIVHDDGPHLTTNGSDDWYLGSQIRDQIDDLDHSTFADSFLVYDRTRYRVLWFVNGTCLVYSYGNQGTGSVGEEGAGVDPLDLRKGKWSKLVLPTDYTVTCGAIIESAIDTPEVWLGGSDSIVYRFVEGVADYAVGSLPRAMTTVIETTYEKLVQGSDIEARLKYLTIKGSGTAASTWTATLTVAKDAGGGGTVRAVSRSVVVGPGITSHKYKVPRGYKGAYCKLKLQHSTQGETGVVEAARVHIIPSPARGER
jgi:hypothetical protein